MFVFLRRSCQYCERSIPFYRHLAVDLAVRHIQFVAVSTDDDVSLDAYIQEKHLTFDRVRSVTPSRFKSLSIAGTPTLVLADGDGVVRGTWLGMLPESGERAVKDAIAHIASSETR